MFWIAVALALLGGPPPAASADAGLECRPGKPPGARDYWSWREIDGRRCWYPGRPGIPKSLLHWGRSSVGVVPVSNPGESTANIPVVDFSGTFIDRWNILPLIFYDPRLMQQWRPLW
jgi:hypothetical protein